VYSVSRPASGMCGTSPRAHLLPSCESCQDRRSVAEPSRRWLSFSPTMPGTEVPQYVQDHERPAAPSCRSSSSTDWSSAPQPSHRCAGELTATRDYDGLEYQRPRRFGRSTAEVDRSFRPDWRITVRTRRVPGFASGPLVPDQQVVGRDRDTTTGAGSEALLGSSSCHRKERVTGEGWSPSTLPYRLEGYVAEPRGVKVKLPDTTGPR